MRNIKLKLIVYVEARVDDELCVAEAVECMRINVDTSSAFSINVDHDLVIGYELVADPAIGFA